MARSVLITTPIPSADEVAERIGLSKTGQRMIRKIIDEAYPSSRLSKPSKGLDGRHRDSDGRITAKRADKKA
jgi:hypothetical protein